MTFGEYHELRMENTATKLQQKAIEMALKGDRTMMIFCLKNLAKWADKIDTDHTSGGDKIPFNYKLVRTDGQND